jgi:hypothetical protein
MMLWDPPEHQLYFNASMAQSQAYDKKYAEYLVRSEPSWLLWGYSVSAFRWDGPFFKFNNIQLNKISL